MSLSQFTLRQRTLREFANADGALPADFDALVRPYPMATTGVPSEYS